MSNKSPHPVDVHVGRRLKLRRNLLGITQGKLGEAVGLTFQQIQKYERGANRIGASRLYQFSNILDLPVSFFFDDMPGDIETRVAEGDIPSDNKNDVMKRGETQELVELYYNVGSPLLRKRLFEMVKALGEEFGSKAAKS